jgi:hypothetical protein
MGDEKMPGLPPGVRRPAGDDAAQPTGAADARPSAATEEGEQAGRARKRAVNVKDHIGRQLRAIYDEVASQPVPDRFMDLLNRLDVKPGEE